jgi:dCTP deaminase
MILSGKAIKQAIQNDVWSCNKPISELQFGSNSVDVTLSGEYLVSTNPFGPSFYDNYIDLENCNIEELFLEEQHEEFLLYPHHLVLTSVNEMFDCSKPYYFTIDDDRKHYSHWVQHYEGRSTLGRMGIQSHMTAGFGDYGFKGAFTLELINNSPWPIILRKGMRIGQVYFEAVLGEVDKYDGYDQTDGKPQYPKLGKGRF